MLRLKTFFLFLIFNISFITSSFALQGVEDIIKVLKNSMAIRDAKSFSEYFDNTIDMTYASAHSTYTRSHAVIILNDFYSKNRPKSFKVDYKGMSPHSDAQYIIGTATTENGPFRVYLYIKNTEGKSIIQEIKIAR